MMDSQLEIKLIECLGLLDAGEPVERILARFPEDAARLRPLLETAGLLPTLHREPTEQARAASRRAFLNQAAAQRERAARRWLWFPPRMALSLASVLIVFLVLGGVSAAAQRALPDSALYPVKRAIEGARLLLAPQGQLATLSAGFDQRRRDEIGALLANKRTAEVQFQGQIEAMAAGRWQISGVPVQITQATAISGTPRIGAQAQVQGRTDAGQLLASIITIEGGGPLPTATATATASATATSTASATPVASATGTPAPLATPPPRSLPTAGTAGRPNNTPVPSAQPTSPPTARATEPPATPTAAPPPTEPPPAETEAEFEGVVEAIGGAAWQISGQLVAIDGATEIRGPISVGDTVRVRARRLANGQLIARRIERRDDNSGSSDDNSGGGEGGSNDNSGGGSDDHGGGGDSGGGGNDNGGHGGDDKKQ